MCVATMCFQPATSAEAPTEKLTWTLQLGAGGGAAEQNHCDASQWLKLTLGHRDLPAHGLQDPASVLPTPPLPTGWCRLSLHTWGSHHLLSTPGSSPCILLAGSSVDRSILPSRSTALQIRDHCILLFPGPQRVCSFSRVKMEKAGPADDQALLGKCSGSGNTFPQPHPGHATQRVGSQGPDQGLNTGTAVKTQNPNH